MIIDFHTHAFPDDLYEKAMTKLIEQSNETPYHKGNIKSLLNSMDKAGITKAVICNIATKPTQFKPILEWSKKIRSERIYPLISVHPLDNNIKEKIKIISDEGFSGIKLHPYYQNFILDDENIFVIYENLIKYNLLLVSHCGFDVVFPKNRISDPEKIVNVKNRFPELKFIAAHFGGWNDWDEVEKHLIGKNIFIEISYSLNILKKEQASRMLNNHPENYLMFGTDSPWTDQSEAVKLLKSYNLEKIRLEKILYKNALNLLKE